MCVCVYIYLYICIYIYIYICLLIYICINSSMSVADQCAVVVVEGMRRRTSLQLVGSGDARP